MGSDGQVIDGEASQRRSLPQVPWGWFSATLLAGLALVGVDVLMALFAFETIVARFGDDTGYFVLYTLSRLIGFSVVYLYIRSKGANLRDLGLVKVDIMRALKRIAQAAGGFLLFSYAIGILLSFVLSEE